MIVTSFLASCLLSAFACSITPQWFRLVPERTWRIAGAIIGALAGACLSPISFITFGWVGASLGAAIGEYSRHWPLGQFAMEIFVPLSVAFGTALVSVLLTIVLFGIIAGLQIIARGKG